MVINDYAARQESAKMAVWGKVRGPIETNNTTIRLLAASRLCPYFMGYFAMPAA